jgi:hypothetical protein
VSLRKKTGYVSPLKNFRLDAWGGLDDEHNMTRKDAGNAHTDVAGTVTKRGHGEHKVGERLKRVGVQAHLAQVISIQCIRTHIRSQAMQCVCVNTPTKPRQREREKDTFLHALQVETIFSFCVYAPKSAFPNLPPGD